jgi:hypothetical protein
VGAGLASGWIWWPSLVGRPRVDRVHQPAAFLAVLSATGFTSSTSASASAPASKRRWPVRAAVLTVGAPELGVRVERK